MKLTFPSHAARATRFITSTRSLLALVAACAALAAVSPVAAQTSYTVVDLTAAGSYGNAYAGAGGRAAGSASFSPNPLDNTRAALWTATGLTDLHPALLGDPANSTSTVEGMFGNLQVGWGIGPNSGMQSAPLAWRGTPKSATFLKVPFATYGSQALATDGAQIVGFAGQLKGTSGGPYHALMWNATSGAVTDLSDAGAEALGVSHGQQVGFISQSSGPVATIWTGTRASQLVIHPKDAVASEALATNGSRQVGFTGYDVRVFDEARKGNTTRRINYATIWNGTDTSAQRIHPAAYTQSYATSIAGSIIVGYAYNGYGLGSVASYHAIRWGAALKPLDLNAFLPAGFTGAIANSVDGQGNITGTIYTADGLCHAAMWVPVR
jgi:hypothetical protein